MGHRCGFKMTLALAALAAATTARAESPGDGGLSSTGDGGIAGATITAAAPVRVRGRIAFEVKAARGSASPAERARAASAILGAILEQPGPPPQVAVDPLDVDMLSGMEIPGGAGDAALRVGGKDVLVLGPPDVAASGLPREVYLESLRVSLQSFVARERRRATLQERGLAVAMAVFLGLLSVFALGWVRRQGARARAWLDEQGAAAGLRVKALQLLSPQASRSTLYLLLDAAALLAQIAIVYAYLAYTLSQFDATRGWVVRLNATLASPFTVLLERLGVALPAAVLLVVGLYVVREALHVVGFFVDNIARGEVQSSWLPRDLASAARPLARVAIVIVALVALGPIVAGAGDGALSRIGLLALATVGLASVPVIAATAVGTVMIFGRKLRPGQWVAIGAHVGEVTELTFVDVCLVPVGAGRVRVPHLYALVVPIRHLPGPPPVEIEVPVSTRHPPAAVIAALEGAALPSTGSAEIALAELGVAANRFRVRIDDHSPGARSALLLRVAEALARAGMSPGTEPARTTPDPPAPDGTSGTD